MRATHYTEILPSKAKSKGKVINKVVDDGLSFE